MAPERAPCDRTTWDDLREPFEAMGPFALLVMLFGFFVLMAYLSRQK